MRKGRRMRKEYEKRTSRTQNPAKNTSGFLIKSPWNAGRMALTSYSKYT